MTVCAIIVEPIMLAHEIGHLLIVAACYQLQISAANLVYGAKSLSTLLMVFTLSGKDLLFFKE